MKKKVKSKKEYASSVDKDGTWLKKRGKYHFGYKKHHVTDNEGYQSKKNRTLLKTRKLKDHILKKAVKNKPLTKWEKRFNKLIGKTRFKVERAFGGIKDGLMEV